MLDKTEAVKGSHLLFNRRQALISIGVAALRGVGWSLPRPIRPLLWEGAHPSLQSSETPLDASIDNRLRDDLARLAPRVYSEEGIPVFLACVNLVPARGSRLPSRPALSPLSGALASSLQRNAEAYQRIRPGAVAKDIAPLIEVLADRDFSRGETTEMS